MIMSETPFGGGPAPANVYYARYGTGDTLVAELSAAIALDRATPSTSAAAQKMRLGAIERARAKIVAQGPQSLSYTQAFATLGDRGDAVRAVRDLTREQLDPAERAKIVASVGDAARNGTFGGRIVAPGTGQREFGRIGQEYQYRSAMDNTSPTGPHQPVNEGVSFTPVQTAGRQPMVFMDYQRRDGTTFMTYRVGLDTQTANGVLAGIVRDPTIVRDITPTVFEARVAGLADAATNSFDNTGPSVDVAVFDGITNNTPPINTAGRMFLPEGSHLQYTAMDQRAVQM
jgi:hypothetical protein